MSLLSSCKSGSFSKPKTITQVEKSQIVFLNFSIKKNPHGNETVQLIEKITVKGLLKNHNKNQQILKKGNLRCNFLDKKLKPIKTIFIQNPLAKTIEYLTPSGQLSKKEVKIDSAEFFIRIQLESKIEYIQISKINGDNSKDSELTVLKLKE
ncbi:MAG: hypothetical protein V3U92_15400 [Cellulophaga sp.]